MTRKLSRADWIKHATRTLTEKGHGALRAQPLARSLGVSRGSFYWHFRDVEALESAVLENWSMRSTEIVIRRLGKDAPAAQRLKTLIRQAFDSDTRLERAIRSWALTNRNAGAAVAAVDRRRTGYIEDLLREIGVPDPALRSRALMLYWASLGRLMIADERLRKMSAREIESMVDLITAHD